MYTQQPDDHPLGPLPPPASRGRAYLDGHLLLLETGAPLYNSLHI